MRLMKHEKRVRYKKRFSWRAKRRTENQCRRAVGKIPFRLRRRVRSTKKGEPPLLFFEFSGYYPLFASVSAVRARKRRDHSPHLQTVSSSGTEDSLPRIPHRAVRQPFSPFPMRFCDPPHYSRMRSHTVPDPSLFSCSALYSPKPR